MTDATNRTSSKTANQNWTLYSKPDGNFDYQVVQAALLQDNRGLLREILSELQRLNESLARIDKRLKPTEFEQDKPFYPPLPMLHSPDDVLVDDMALPLRAHHCLMNHGILTLSQLTQQTEADLLRMPNFGKVSLKEVKDVLLDEYGKTLKG